MTEINKQIRGDGHYEASFYAEKTSPCQRCKEEGVIVPHVPKELINCPRCGDPFSSPTDTREERPVVIRPPTSGERFRGMLGRWLTRTGS